MSIVCREHHRAAGRLTVFSMLNVDAARLAREGLGHEALSFAKAAAKIERGGAFHRLRELISGTTPAEAATALQGTSTTPSAELIEVLRLIAIETLLVRQSRAVLVVNLQTVAGRISETLPDVVVLETSSQRTYVPRGLAEAANRTKVGDLLALVTERFSREQVAFEVLPAISVEGAGDKKASPFGRSAPIHRVTEKDARLLRRTPAPLTVLIPVTVGK